jgi:hypothetical protein
MGEKKISVDNSCNYVYNIDSYLIERFKKCLKP